MNIRLLEIFRAVMIAQSTVGAARALTISQPAVSNAIRQLEATVGFALFDRTGNRLVPRDEARILFDESEAIALVLTKLDQTVDDLQASRLGHVRVFATPQLGHSVVPGAIRQFLKNRPRVKVYLHVRDSYKVIESVAASAADFGLATALEPQLADSFAMVPIASVEMVCIVPLGHPLVKHRMVTPKHLKPFPIIGLDSAARLSPLVRTAFSNAGVPYGPMIEVRYSDTACLLVIAGNGVAVVDWFSASAHARRSNLAIIPFRPRIEVAAWAIFPKARTPSRLAQALLDSVHVSTRRFLDGAT